MNNQELKKHKDKPGPINSMAWITFAFEYKDNQIIVRNSNWSTKEQVFINDELVHDKKSMQMQMNESFDLPGGEKLKIAFGTSFKKGVFIEASSEEGEVYSYISSRDPKFLAIIILLMVIGGFFGFVIAETLLG